MTVTARQDVSADSRDVPSCSELAPRERDMLRFLLELDAPGVEELRAQAQRVTVANHCPCGCPTIELAVDRQAAPAAAAAREPVFAWARAARTAQSSYHVILFVSHGWLRELEYVALSDPVPGVFPVTLELATAVSGDAPLGPVGAPR